MEELDEDRLELLERRLADRLTERVRSELLKLYAAMGATAISVLGLVGWNILQNLESGIKENIKDNLEEEIKPTRIQINKQLAETEVLAKQANGIVEKVKKQLDAFQPQAENLDNNIKLMEELSVRVQELNTNLRPVQGSTERDLYPIASSVKSLQRQLIELAIQVDKLNTIVTVSVQKPGGESAQAAQQRKAAIQSVISATQKAEQSLLFLEKRGRVEPLVSTKFDTSTLKIGWQQKISPKMRPVLCGISDILLVKFLILKQNLLYLIAGKSLVRELLNYG